MPRHEAFIPELSRFAERQLRHWEIGRTQHHCRTDVAAGPILDFVTVSNAVGAGGKEIAASLSQQLGWPVFDRNILQLMAGDDDLRAQRYASLDERTVGWLEGVVHFLLDQRFVRQDYFNRLRATVLWLARQEHSIFLGRFADLILPRDIGLRVKVVAPPEKCVENFAEKSGMSLDDASAAVRRIERERAEFVEHHFPGRGGDYSRFDLLINSEHFITGQAVKVVVEALACRGCAVFVRA